jgi:thiamine-phosphate pyrophosphorylase
VIRIVAVTDRTRCSIDDMLVRAAAIVARVPRGTVRFQIREKDLDGGPLLRFAKDLIAIARPAGAEVWINDRVDIALACAADGVQLPEHGLGLAEARALAGSLAVGCSRHSQAGARDAAAAGADVVQLGPIWATPSKAGILEPLGPDALELRLGVPLVAVGGIDSPARARDAAKAGADAVAVIRAWTVGDPGATIAEMVTAIESAHRSGS